MKTRALALALLVLSVAPFTSGHEFWLEPSSFHPPVGSEVSARIFVGENFVGDPYPRNPMHISRFFLAGPGGDAEMAGETGGDPAGAAPVVAQGFQLIGYESYPSSVLLTPEKLAVYLEKEGLEPFFPGDKSAPIEDHFSRFAKALLLAGDPSSRPRGYGLRLGFPLELVPEADPARLAPEEGLPVVLLKEGKPLEGAQVTAKRKSEGTRQLSARTDAQGRVVFHLPGPGLWLINAVYLRPVLGGYEGHWQSWWASLTFEIP